MADYCEFGLSVYEGNKERVAHGYWWFGNDELMKNEFLDGAFIVTEMWNVLGKLDGSYI